MLAARESWLWAAALVFPVVLFVQAYGSDHAASDLLAEGVRAGVLESPALERLTTQSLRRPDGGTGTTAEPGPGLHGR